MRSWYEGPGIEDSGALLRGLRSLVSPLLVGEQGWEWLVARADGLPASAVGFEFRLGDPAPETDFVISHVPGSAAEQAWIRRGRDAEPSSMEAALARHLACVGDALAPVSLWTMHEYDAAPVSDAPSPAVFQGAFPPRPGEPPALDAGRAGYLAAALGRVVGWAADAREVAAVERLTAALPPPGVTSCIGAMPGREPRMIRVLIDGIDAARLADTLKRIGWPDSTGAVLAALDTMEGRFHRIKIQLGVSAQGPLPGIGLELYPQPKPLTVRPISAPWRPVLARLEEAGWCLPRKSRGLLTFPGHEHILDGEVFEACTWINHVKLSIDGDRVRTAKAYAGLQYRRFRPGSDH